MSDFRWGFMDGGTFVEVPRGPLEQAGLHPPCIVETYAGTRHIIEEPALRTTIRPSCHGFMVTVVRPPPHWMAFAYEAPTEAAARAEADRVIADVLARDQERIARHLPPKGQA